MLGDTRSHNDPLIHVTVEREAEEIVAEGKKIVAEGQIGSCDHWAGGEARLNGKALRPARQDLEVGWKVGGPVTCGTKRCVLSNFILIRSRFETLELQLVVSK